MSHASRLLTWARANFLTAVVVILALLLLSVHTRRPDEYEVDSISVALLVVILIAPFARQIRRLKLFDFEVELTPQERSELDMGASAAEQQVAPAAGAPPIDDETMQLYEALRAVDPNVAVVQLRRDLEVALREAVAGETPRMSLGRLVREFGDQHAPDAAIAAGLARAIEVGNRVVHGQKLDRRDAAAIVDDGLAMLTYVRSKSLAPPPR